MGLSVAISGGIILTVFVLILFSLPGLADKMFSIGDITSQVTQHEQKISNTEIDMNSLSQSVGSSKVNFTLGNDGSEKLWNFEDFDLFIEYDGAISGKTTQQLSYIGECLGTVPQAGNWCIQSISSDVADPQILNFGEQAYIRTNLNENLASETVIVTVVTDNGVTFKTGNPSCGGGIPLPFCKKSGWFMPSSAADDATGGFGGILSDIASDGGQTYGDDADGTRWSTPVTVTGGTDGGIQSANANNFHEEWNIKLIAKIQQSATSSHRIFVGFKQSAAMPNSDSICGAGGGSECAGFVIDSDDAAWQIITNNGDAAETRTACTSGCTDDTLVHTLQVRSDAANNRWGFTWDDNPEQFVSTDTPAAATDLFVDVEMESTGTNNSIEIYHIYVETDS
jgi:archaellum component FlaF (FlaF/FlaG flagellin family)